MNTLLSKFFTLLLAFFLTSLCLSPQLANAASIDTAPYSGVVGYDIGIFGSGFGSSQGSSTVKIGNQNAPILEWRNTMIRAKIPSLPDGNATLTITTSSGNSSWPFTVYSVNPSFLVQADDMQNIALGKAVYFSTPDDNTYIGASPATKLSRNDEQWPGYLVMKAGSYLAINLGQQLNEDVWWTMFGGTTGWGPESSEGRAKDYVIEASRNSTNGGDGNWDILRTVTGSERISLTEKVRLSNHNWIRMRTTATTNNVGFTVNEVRVHKRSHKTSGNRVESLVIMGDSNTYADFRPLRDDLFFPSILARARGTDTEIVHFPIGLIAAQASAMAKAEISESGLKRALEQLPSLDYWGFAFGTNDSLSSYSSDGYKQNVREGIDQVLAANKVPLIARMVDCGPNGYGTPENKKTILKAIDELNAEYRLIPGPDLYTPFRKNIEFGGMSYFGGSSGDQTHHAEEGGLVVEQLWADALVKSGIYSNSNPPLPTATPVVVKPGDANGDNIVNAQDFAVWLTNYFQTKQGFTFGDFDNSGLIDGIDYIIWRNNSGK